MILLADAMLPVPHKAVTYHIEAGSDRHDLPLHDDAERLISRVCALQQRELATLAKRISEEGALAFCFPRVDAAGVILSIDDRHIVGRRGLEIAPKVAIHIGIAPRIHQDILASQRKIQVQPIEVTMSAAHASTAEVRVICILSPSGS